LIATGQGRRGVGSIELDYAVPSADLAEYITLFYDFSADVPMLEDGHLQKPSRLIA